MVAGYTPLAQARGVDLGLPRVDAVEASGGAAALRTLLSNLVYWFVMFTVLLAVLNVIGIQMPNDQPRPGRVA